MRNRRQPVKLCSRRQRYQWGTGHQRTGRMFSNVFERACPLHTSPTRTAANGKGRKLSEECFVMSGYALLMPVNRLPSHRFTIEKILGNIVTIRGGFILLLIQGFLFVNA